MEKLQGGYINQAFRKDTQVVKYYQECPTVFVPVDKRFTNEVSSLMRYGGIYAPKLYEADFANCVVTVESIY